MAALTSSPAPPLHVQHLEKALRLEPFLNHVEGFLSDPSLAGFSDTEDSELSDLEKDIFPKPTEGHSANGIINGDLHNFLSPDELRIDKSRLYNFSKIKKERKWLKEVLLSDSSDSSDDDEPLSKDELQEMLQLHVQHRKACQAFALDADLERYQYYGASLICSSALDKYHEFQRQFGNKNLKRRKLKDGKVKLVKVKQEKLKIKKKKKSNKGDDQEDEQRRLTVEEKSLKKSLVRRKEADARRRKLWGHIVRKEIPRTQRQKSSARNNMLTNAKKLAQMCQKEMRREAIRSQKVAMQTAPRARRLAREMMVYWKKYDKVEKEHRKRAEKEAMEQRKLDDELVEARRQQRKLNFLITQTELYAHFMSKKIQGLSTSGQDETAHEILKKLDEPSSKQNIKSVSGGVLIDMENSDNYDSEVMKSKALNNAHKAFEDQDNRTKEFDSSYQQESGKKKLLSQESFDNTFSLANPMLDIKDHPQPSIFRGTLKSYQLKGMNWLFNLYEQGINGILADEMGLGKTVQSIAFLSLLAEGKHKWGPFLIVAPASTLHNWQQEVSRFVPLFKILPYWGNQADRKSLRKYWNQKQSHINDRDNAPFHVLITSYQLVVQDVRYFQRIRWQYVVLDEAQAIKSSSSVRWKILLGFQCRNRLLLTGTPIQNSMAELWALLHFIMPTLFDDHEEFNEWFSKDIESHAENKSGIDQNQLSRLHMILKPFMLRRIKRDVEDELSEKIEIKVVCGLTTRQQRLYQAVKKKISIDDLVYSTNSSSTASATTSNLMNLVMQFRKVCNHPELFERRDVRSPLHLCLEPFHLPKLVYREGILDKVSFSRLKILYSLMNIGNADYIHKSLFGTTEKAPPSGCFSFLRFINVSPGEASVLMVKNLVLRLLALLLLLEEATNLHHRWFWEEHKTKSRYLGRRSLLLWPNYVTAFPNIQSSSVFSSLVFTGYTRSTVSHTTHLLTPIVVEDEGKSSGKKRTSTGSALTSPSKHHHHHHHKHRHHKHHPEHSSVTHPHSQKHAPSAIGEQQFSGIKHSPTGPFSPPAHHMSGVTGSQAASQQLTAAHYKGNVVPTARSSTNRDVQGHQPSPLHSPTSPLSPPFGMLSPTRQGGTDNIVPQSESFSGANRLLSPQHNQKWPIERALQPTELPSFLFTYVPKIASVSGLFYCSDRSAAYEVTQTLKGGDELSKRLLMYGTACSETLEQRKHHLFPTPLGGVEGATPKSGWSHVQIPNRNSLITDSGKLKVLDTLLTQMKARGHRVLIYSQMTRMIDLLEEYMNFRKHKYMRLDGSSKISDRRDMVKDFQTKSDIFVFLLSTRAGGLGINLTAADTVIFYDSDWNPTVDQQAMDRAHRLGQTKQVTVYRLVTKGSIEERILQRAKEKSEIQRMVISGGHFKPDALKPKEVVSLLLDDAELESKFLMRQAEKKADEQRKRRERKRKKGSITDDTSNPGSVASGDQIPTAPPKAKKGRKSKASQFVPPMPDVSLDSVRGSASEAGSTSGEIVRLENADGDVTAADDISVMSLDDLSVVSGEGSLLSIEAQQSATATPLSSRLDNDDSNLDDTLSGTGSPISNQREGSKRGRGRITRGRTRGRGTGTTRGRGTGSIRGSRGRGRGRGGSGALAASAAASAAAAAASAAAYAAYGFSFQGSTPNPAPPPSRSSPVAFSAGGSVVPAYGTAPGTGGGISRPVAKYENPLSTGNQSETGSVSKSPVSSTPSGE